CLQYASSPTF
nr:immunoglobulin light chain junction region [Mus musculus]NSL97560.1 immunoglobulin light chain junction region [Mus musculus]NSL98177.1 immunoglobulin light chain junction region [Mus musculus]NSL99882.1 immunoglobulin light chain junction region [Mus musculus]NSM01455.1 immunoglobulin light chain junction region [Mus musculus]